MSSEPLITDRIEYGGFYYKIMNVQEAKNFLTEVIEYYTADLERERIATLNETLAIV